MTIDERRSAQRFLSALDALRRRSMSMNDFEREEIAHRANATRLAS